MGTGIKFCMVYGAVILKYLRLMNSVCCVLKSM